MLSDIVYLFFLAHDYKNEEKKRIPKFHREVLICMMVFLSEEHGRTEGGEELISSEQSRAPDIYQTQA